MPNETTQIEDRLGGEVSNTSQISGNDITDTLSSNQPEPDNRSFEERARAFLEDLERGAGFEIVNREVGHSAAYGPPKVGTGIHTGLVYKGGYVAHAKQANRFYHELMKHFKERGYEPYSYELIKPDYLALGETVGVVQEYYDKPTLRELMGFLVARKKIMQRERKLGTSLADEEKELIRRKYVRHKGEVLRCEQFLNELPNRNIALEQMREVEREFYADRDYLRLQIIPENVIVLGHRTVKDLQRIGLAIIDY